MTKASEQHLEELRELGYTGNSLDELRDVEARAHKAAEDYCNVEGFDWESAENQIWADVQGLFGGYAPKGFFVNGDPRGYALKLQSGTGSLTQRDWGDFELLAPEFEDGH